MSIVRDGKQGSTFRKSHKVCEVGVLRSRILGSTTTSKELVQVTHPYMSTDSTVAVNRRCLICRESVDFHIRFSLLCALRVIAFLILMSLSVGAKVFVD